eukprot:TRINITY_DN103920_c0_g1_i1.p1 TRINITY_DN103920_c0_g1~~TRINITY_DN103920_c0_g1_i1.p1  ORF type:complete len:634 (-),score=110.09 TRINITY_DN103920_c0_g1_i1:108-2009(-)
MRCSLHAAAAAIVAICFVQPFVFAHSHNGKGRRGGNRGKGGKDKDSDKDLPPFFEANGRFAYVVIIDAGSTGSRAFAFKYASRQMEPTAEEHSTFIVGKPLTIPEDVFNIKFSPGISNFQRDPVKLTKYITNMCESIKKRLLAADESVLIPEVPIYLGATAGMRDLSGSERHRVFEVIRAAMSKSEFFFNSVGDKGTPSLTGHENQARVLSGEEEGAFDWLTVNKYYGTISNNPAETYGALDMGGQSAEIAFIPRDPSIMGGMFPMHFGNFPGTIHLYTHSFMHYGQIEAFQWATREWFGGSAGAGDLVEHPCLPAGLRWLVTPFEYGVSTSGPVTRTDGQLDMRGSQVYNHWYCKQVAKKLIMQAQCTQKPCSFLGVYQPNTTGSKFVMTGQFADVWNALRPATDRPVLEALDEASQDFCSKSYDQQTALLRSRGIDTADNALVCWLGVWSVVFVTEGLGFIMENPNLKVANGVSADWPTGASIYHVNFYPYRVRNCNRYELKAMELEQMRHSWRKAQKRRMAKHFENSCLNAKGDWFPKDRDESDYDDDFLLAEPGALLSSIADVEDDLDVEDDEYDEASLWERLRERGPICLALALGTCIGVLGTLTVQAWSWRRSRGLPAVSQAPFLYE